MKIVEGETFLIVKSEKKETSLVGKRQSYIRQCYEMFVILPTSRQLFASISWCETRVNDSLSIIQGIFVDMYRVKMHQLKWCSGIHRRSVTCT